MDESGGPAKGAVVKGTVVYNAHGGGGSAGGTNVLYSVPLEDGDALQLSTMYSAVNKPRKDGNNHYDLPARGGPLRSAPARRPSAGTAGAYSAYAGFDGADGTDV